MQDFGWRTLVIDSGCSLSYDNGCLLASGEKETEIPLSQLRTVIVHSPAVTVSGRLLNALAESKISVIFCDEKHNPHVELCAIDSAAGRIMDQMQWCEERKAWVWREIVRQKIANQQRVLALCRGAVPVQMQEYADAVMPGDVSNREGQAARVYFRALFGEGFIRQTADAVNSALNYGYALILSSFTRIITVHGYHTALGIQHCSRENRFNLACDLMEPFRPIVDLTAADNPRRELDWHYKKQLIELLQRNVVYGGRTMVITDAMEQFALDVFGALAGEQREIKEIIIEP